MQISTQNTLSLINIIIKSIFPDLAMHMQRTAYISLIIAKELNLHKNEIENIYIASNIHDIGFIDKKWSVTASRDIVESEYITEHEANGVMMLNEISIFEPALTIIGQHHISWVANNPEKYPLECHILHMADAFELFTQSQLDNNISYEAIKIVDVIEENNQFPPELITALYKVIKHDILWYRLASTQLEQTLEDISPVKKNIISTDDLLEVCQLIAKIIDTYSNFTMSHSIKVAKISRFIAEKMELPLESQKQIQIAGYLHDIGKLYIPIHILEKKGRLTASEYSLMRIHSYKTDEMLSQIEPLRNIKHWAANHHERLDGSGYPRGLVAYKLDLPSKILAIADVFTAMAEDRPYRKGMKPERILDIIDEEVQNNRLEKVVFDVLKSNIKSAYSIINNV
ncbi:HD domain-containing phosphohydrolase [Klebsiella pneumoniae]|uniref:HD domain-containing phosphohydrolase n=1 Tax=Klebsiella pneumoniae TaxID=573 RepID=UPI001F418037|nr:HD domain-containing phosphohydrolase [Klebsiella pneumoniae]MCE4096870.1 HD domain-containing protein [Klebsiella pneumoniae]